MMDVDYPNATARTVDEVFYSPDGCSQRSIFIPNPGIRHEVRMSVKKPATQIEE
jgi:hypothetical protein